MRWGAIMVPAPCIEGAVQAAKELDVEIILVGDETILKQECERLACHDSRISIRHASQVVEMHESPAAVARKKRDSSIWVGTELVKNGQAECDCESRQYRGQHGGVVLLVRVGKGG
jgi:phosphate acyltransferase